MLLKRLPLFFFSKGFSSQLCSVGLSVPVVYVAVSQQPSLLTPLCPPLFARPQACPSVLSFLQLCMLLYHSNPPCPPLPARPQACPLVLSFLQLCMLLYHSNPPCSPLLARLSLLAPPCPPLPARPQACPLVLSFLQLCMLLYYSNPLVARVMASSFSRCQSSAKKNFVV